jgi:hypothetical protein
MPAPLGQAASFVFELRPDYPKLRFDRFSKFFRPLAKPLDTDKEVLGLITGGQ